MDSWRPESITVRLERGWTLTGVAQEVDGSPTPARIVLEIGPGGHSFHPTDAQGRFRLAALPPGPARIRAVPITWRSLNDVLSIDPEPEPKEFEQGSTDVVLQVEQTREVRVRVRGPDGEPVHTIEVELSRGGGRAISRRSGDDVRLLEPLSPAILTLRRPRDAQGKELPYGPYSGPAPAAQAEPIEIRLPRGRRLRGQVLGADGRPLAGARVRAATPRPDGSAPYWDRAWNETTTAADGGFTLGNLAGGPLIVSVAPPPGHVALDDYAVSPDASEVTLTLEAGREAVVRVVDEAGKPIPGAAVSWHRVTIEGPGSEHYTGHSDRLTGQDGRAVLGTHSPEQILDVAVDPPEGGALLMRTTLRMSGPKEEQVTLREGMVVRGVVLRASGEPASGARVRRRALALPDDPYDWHTVAEADERGGFRTRPMSKAAHWLQATGALGGSDPMRPGPGVRVEPTTEEVTLHLQPGLVALVVKVPGAAAKRWVLAGPSADPMRPEDADEEHGRLYEDPETAPLPEDGQTVTLWLPPGPTRIWVPPTEDDPRSAFLTADAPGAVEVVLGDGESITVTAVLPPGATEVAVYAHGPYDSVLGAHPPGADGTYVIRALPAGTWKVGLYANVEGDIWHDSARVAAGEAVRLTAKAGTSEAP
jgi:hypothetical protein